MDTKTIKQGISYLTNEKGKQTAVIFDLKNKAVKELMEDFMDTIEAMESLSDTNPRKSLEEITKTLV